MNLGNQPVEVLVEDVYLLVVPSAESTYDPAEEEKRRQAAKMERIENAELLHVRGKSDVSQGEWTYVNCLSVKAHDHQCRITTVRGIDFVTHYQNNQ